MCKLTGHPNVSRQCCWHSTVDVHQLRAVVEPNQSKCSYSLNSGDAPYLTNLVFIVIILINREARGGWRLCWHLQCLLYELTFDYPCREYSKTPPYVGLPKVENEALKRVSVESPLECVQRRREQTMVVTRKHASSVSDLASTCRQLTEPAAQTGTNSKRKGVGFYAYINQAFHVNIVRESVMKYSRNNFEISKKNYITLKDVLCFNHEISARQHCYLSIHSVVNENWHSFFVLFSSFTL